MAVNDDYTDWGKARRKARQLADSHRRKVNVYRREVNGHFAGFTLSLEGDERPAGTFVDSFEPSEGPTPARPTYAAWKATNAKHPDYIALYRVGEMYETYGPDAAKVNRTIGLGVETIQLDGGGQSEMVIVPAESLEVALRKLIAAGHRVAIAEPNKTN